MEQALDAADRAFLQVKGLNATTAHRQAAAEYLKDDCTTQLAALPDAYNVAPLEQAKARRRLYCRVWCAVLVLVLPIALLAMGAAGRRTMEVTVDRGEAVALQTRPNHGFTIPWLSTQYTAVVPQSYPDWDSGGKRACASSEQLALWPHDIRARTSVPPAEALNMSRHAVVPPRGFVAWYTRGNGRLHGELSMRGSGTPAMQVCVCHGSACGALIRRAIESDVAAMGAFRERWGVRQGEEGQTMTASATGSDVVGYIVRNSAVGSGSAAVELTWTVHGDVVRVDGGAASANQRTRLGMGSGLEPNHRYTLYLPPFASCDSATVAVKRRIDALGGWAIGGAVLLAALGMWGSSKFYSQREAELVAMLTAHHGVSEDEEEDKDTESTAEGGKGGKSDALNDGKQAARARKRHRVVGGGGSSSS